MGKSNTEKKENQKHISIKTTKEAPTLKEDLKELAKNAGRRFNDYVIKLLKKHVEDERAKQ